MKLDAVIGPYQGFITTSSRISSKMRFKNYSYTLPKVRTDSDFSLFIFLTTFDNSKFDKYRPWFIN